MIKLNVFVVVHLWPEGLGDPTVMPEVHSLLTKADEAAAFYNEHEEVPGHRYTVAQLATEYDPDYVS